MEGKWEDMSRRLVQTRDDIAPADFNRQHFSEHPDIASIVEATNESWQVISDKLSELVREAELVIDDWYAKKNAADWMRTLKTDMEQYESLSTKLEQQGIRSRQISPAINATKEHYKKELDLISEYQLCEKESEAEKTSGL